MISNEEKKAIDILRFSEKLRGNRELHTERTAIEIVLNLIDKLQKENESLYISLETENNYKSHLQDEIKKKDKIIDLMGKNIKSCEDEKGIHVFNPLYNSDYIIQYFYNRVEKKMSKADDIFKELGYEKRSSKVQENFVLCSPDDELLIKIVFNNKTKRIAIHCNGEALDMQELQAINEKVKELRVVKQYFN